MKKPETCRTCGETFKRNERPHVLVIGTTHHRAEPFHEKCLPVVVRVDLEPAGATVILDPRVQ